MDDVPNYEVNSFRFNCIQSKNITAYLLSTKEEGWHNDFEEHLSRCSSCNKKLISESFKDISIQKMIPAINYSEETGNFLDFEISELMSKFINLSPEPDNTNPFFRITDSAKKFFKSLI